MDQHFTKAIIIISLFVTASVIPAESSTTSDPTWTEPTGTKTMTTNPTATLSELTTIDTTVAELSATSPQLSSTDPTVTDLTRPTTTGQMTTEPTATYTTEHTTNPEPTYTTKPITTEPETTYATKPTTTDPETTNATKPTTTDPETTYISESTTTDQRETDLTESTITSVETTLNAAISSSATYSIISVSLDQTTTEAIGTELPVCAPGYFGNKCQFKCLCADHTETCDMRSGHCRSGCPPGRRGPGCNLYVGGDEPVVVVLGLLLTVALVLMLTFLLLWIRTKREHLYTTRTDDYIYEFPDMASVENPAYEITK